jgi:sterol carrier protein 2
MSGIPVINVNNNCSTGSTALFLARQAIASGAADCVLALGFEQMQPGAIGAMFSDRPSPFRRFDETTDALVGWPDVPLALRYFGGAGMAHMQKFGTPLETFAKVRAKASRHAVNNPLALFRRELTVDDVLASPAMIPGVMTRLMACAPTCGAAAAVLVSEAYARRHGLSRTVRIAAQAMTTDTPATFDSGDMMRLVGYDMSRSAAMQVYEAAGIGADDVDVVELHDCFAQNEVLSYEALGLCAEGGAQQFVDDGDNTYGGSIVTNPSGGLLAKGHPGRNGYRAVPRADAAVARHGGGATGAGRAHRVAAQPGPRRGMRRHALCGWLRVCGTAKARIGCCGPDARCSRGLFWQNPTPAKPYPARWTTGGAPRPGAHLGGPSTI